MSEVKTAEECYEKFTQGFAKMDDPFFVNDREHMDTFRRLKDLIFKRGFITGYDSLAAELEQCKKEIEASKKHHIELHRRNTEKREKLAEAVKALEKYESGEAYEYNRAMRGEVAFCPEDSSILARQTLEKLKGGGK